MKKYNYFLLLIVLSSSINAYSQVQSETMKPSLDSSEIALNEVIVSANVFFGSKANTINRTGSAYYLSTAELAKQSHTDISRILAKVPGVTSYDEDGFGLRPNISLRGVSAERSAKITVMEDGVLIAPAPYSAPAAYYFPMAQRMSAVEILKGSSQIEFGPFTTGGAINMVSTPVSEEKISGRVRLNTGSFGNRNATIRFGQNLGQFAYIVEAYNQGSNGFKELPDPSANTGFNRNDFLAKARYATRNTKKIAQSIELKLQYSDELSNETYLGISQEDFDNNSRQRYAASTKDKMVTEHFQAMITHTVDFGKSFRVSTIAYRNNFTRNWYKLNDVVIGGSKKSLAAILDNPANNVSAYEILRGANSGANSLIMKNNNRAYLAQGIQTKLDKHWSSGAISHDLEVGARFHYDAEDRFQWVDGYQMQNGTMVLTNRGVPGTDANRITSANAFSSHVLYKLSFKNRITFTPGVRYENINLSRVDYGINNLERTGDSFTTKQNKIDQLIPGIGINYKPNSKTAVFGGIHRGFSPPSVESGSLPESSVNTEAGVRFSKKKLYAELVIYNNNYSNLLGSDLAASGGTGTLTLFNAGEARVNGIETLLNYEIEFGNKSAVKIPLEASYTFTNSTFLNAFSSNEGIWGAVMIGDQLPYIPRHQAFTSIGLEISKFTTQLTGRYNGAFRTQAGSGEIPTQNLVPGYFVADFAANYQLNKKLRLNLNVNNLFNNNYLVARVPAGLRPGLPFAAMGGFEFKF